MDRFSLFPHISALAAAYALAFPIALNREMQSRSAGLRTFPIVAIAACGFIQITESITVDSPDSMTRIVAGLITGVGFIGGGAILKYGDTVHGTATAASLWVTGAIGAAVGLGVYDVAIALSVATTLTLLVLSWWKDKGRADCKGSEDGNGDDGQA